MANIASDTAVVRDAQERANAILRSADNCDSVKVKSDDVQAALDKFLQSARTETGRTAIANLKKQVRDVAAACP